jgi:hypothetical protein
MANLDTPSKRASSVQMLLWSVLAPVLPDGSIALADRQHTAHTYSGIASTITEDPEDSDSDTTYTAFVDRDGATVRVPRVDVLTAPDSASNAELGNVERIAADRYISHALRVGRGRMLASTHRILIQSYRAGEATAIRAVIVEYEAVRPEHRIRSDNTTTKADRDGASLMVPTATLLHAADSVRNADLRASGDDQDRYRADFWCGSSTAAGNTHRMILQSDGRAGSAMAVRSVIVDYSKVGSGDNLVRAAAT